MGCHRVVQGLEQRGARLHLPLLLPVPLAFLLRPERGLVVVADGREVQPAVADRREGFPRAGHGSGAPIQ